MTIHPTFPAPSAGGSTDSKTVVPQPRKPGEIDDRGDGRKPQPTEVDKQVMAFLDATQYIIAGLAETDPAEAGRLIFTGAKALNDVIDPDHNDTVSWTYLARIEAQPFTDDYCRRLTTIDLRELSPDQVIASAIAFAQCPPWCDPAECCPDDQGTSPIHAGIIDTITDRVNQDTTEVEVRIERQDINGVPGKAYVAVKPTEMSSMLEFTVGQAGRLANAIGQAQRAVIRDQGNPEGGIR